MRDSRIMFEKGECVTAEYSLNEFSADIRLTSSQVNAMLHYDGMQAFLTQDTLTSAPEQKQTSSRR